MILIQYSDYNTVSMNDISETYFHKKPIVKDGKLSSYEIELFIMKQSDFTEVLVVDADYLQSVMGALDEHNSSFKLSRMYNAIKAKLESGDD